MRNVRVARCFSFTGVGRYGTAAEQDGIDHKLKLVNQIGLDKISGQVPTAKNDHVVARLLFEPLQLLNGVTFDQDALPVHAR